MILADGWASPRPKVSCQLECQNPFIDSSLYQIRQFQSFDRWNECRPNRRQMGNSEVVT